MTTKTDITPRTYYLTKYALSDGVRSVNGCLSHKGGCMVGHIEGYPMWTSFELGKDIFVTLPEAIADADARRVRKIASLKKQIAKLENLTFGEAS